MTNHCCSCSDRQSLKSYWAADQTWSHGADVTRGNWTPFGNNWVWQKYGRNDAPGVRENFCASSSCSSSPVDFEQLNRAWTISGNVTPGNSDIYNSFPIPARETYTNPNNYMTGTQTWLPQKPYIWN